jgi:hypothetical protein
MPNSAAADIDRHVKVIDGEGNDDRSIERISDLRARPYVVLLGEPGIGKSTVLASEAASEGLPVISVRELMTGTSAQPDATLFLDALDEYRTDGGAEDKVHTLANTIAKFDPPRWRLTCRSEDWRKAADIAPISKTAAGHSITVAQLLPLDSDEAGAITRTKNGELCEDEEGRGARFECTAAAGMGTAGRMVKVATDNHRDLSYSRRKMGERKCLGPY